MKTAITFALVAICCIIATQTVSAQVTCPVSCQFGASNRFPHFTSCNRYYECQSGYLFDFDCGQYEVFDVQTLQCRGAGDGLCILDQDARGGVANSRAN